MQLFHINLKKNLNFKVLKFKINFLQSLDILSKKPHIKNIKNLNRTFRNMCNLPPLIGLKRMQNTCASISLNTFFIQI